MKNYLREFKGERDMFENPFEDIFDFNPFSFFPSIRLKNEMRTDIREKDGNVELQIEMPGFLKDQINLELNDGYLTVSANRHEKTENKEGYIRQERNEIYQRSYFVGESVTPEKVKAKYDNGVLSLVIPKEVKKEIPSKSIKID